MTKLLLACAILLGLGTNAEGRSRRALPELESKLYTYIAGSQYRDRSYGRFYGAWHVEGKVGAIILANEANSFLTAKQMLALQEVHRHYDLPWYDQLTSYGRENLDGYLKDAERTSEPKGTIAYYPIVDSSGRRGVNAPVGKVFPQYNVPNDLDSSSHAFLWFLKTGRERQYIRDFVSTVGDWRDLGRSALNSNDVRWKSLNSGAFLTWAEPDRHEDPRSRVFDRVNDVDCVVNLNVLTALGAYQKSHSLPPKTLAGVKASCSLVNQAVKAGAVPACGKYYDRPSEFWISYANARTSGVKCLGASEAIVQAEMQARARAIIHRGQTNNPTETAEIIVALKKLNPPSKRNSEVSSLLVNLDALLRSSMVVKGDIAYPATHNSLFMVRFLGAKVDWYSKPFTATLALQAMTLP